MVAFYLSVSGAALSILGISMALREYLAVRGAGESVSEKWEPIMQTQFLTWFGAFFLFIGIIISLQYVVKKSHET